MLGGVNLDRDLSVGQPAGVTVGLEDGRASRALGPLLVLFAVLKSLHEQVLFFLLELESLQEESLMAKVLAGVFHHLDTNVDVYLLSSKVELSLLHLAFDYLEVLELREGDLSVQVLDEAVDLQGVLLQLRLLVEADHFCLDESQRFHVFIEWALHQFALVIQVHPNENLELLVLAKRLV